LTSTRAAGKVRVSIFEARSGNSGELDVPNIASAKKNMRKARAATIRNRAQRAALRTALKKAKAPSASAEERLKAVSLLDRAARKGLIHSNAAARHKSRLATATKA
jgi:small subunit ribosomal protein S20